MADKSIDYRKLGKRIQQRRLQLNLSQNQASESLDISTSFLGRVERGEKIPSLETLVKISRKFQSSLDFLLQDSIGECVSDKLQIELAEVFADKTPEQAERLVNWLIILSNNIDSL